MRRKTILLVTSLAIAFLLNGCVTKLIEMDEDQENAFVSYAAAAVAKYNKNMSTGITVVSDPPKASNSEEEKEESTSPEFDQNVDASQIEDAREAAEADPSAGINPGIVSAGESGSTATGSVADLTSIINIEGVSFDVKGASVQDSYKSGNYMALIPEKGNTYLVYRIEATNNSDADVDLDLLSKGISYTAIAGSTTVSADSTILLNDLSTYQATLKAKESTELVLLFQFPSSSLTSESSYSLGATSNGNTVTIE